MVIDQHNTNHIHTLIANHGCMMPAAAALAIFEVRICNECNEILIHVILQAAREAACGCTNSFLAASTHLE
jgi:hypothetical protein